MQPSSERRQALPACSQFFGEVAAVVGVNLLFIHLYGGAEPRIEVTRQVELLLEQLAHRFRAQSQFAQP